MSPGGTRAALDRLSRMAGELAVRYRTAIPFPHVVIDDALHLEVLRRAAAEFPDYRADTWTNLPGDDQRNKQITRGPHALPPACRMLVDELNSGPFLEFLEALTGIEGLVADTRLVGGGLHQTGPGGKLSVHVDFSHHPSTHLDRRLNLLLYLNEDWDPSFGGEFEMWDAEAKARVCAVAPVMNRVVIFSTSHRSFHGQPEPLRCPPDRVRKSIALYYFTAGRPEEERVPHNTDFRSRPGEVAALRTRLLRAAGSGIVRDLVPPLLYRRVRRMWARAVTGR